MPGIGSIFLWDPMQLLHDGICIIPSMEIMSCTIIIIVWNRKKYRMDIMCSGDMKINGCLNLQKSI